MPMSRLDHARTRFLGACARFDQLTKATFQIRLLRDGGYAWSEHERALQIAGHVKREALEELRLAQIACPPRQPRVRLR